MSFYIEIRPKPKLSCVLTAEATEFYFYHQQKVDVPRDISVRRQIFKQIFTRLEKVKKSVILLKYLKLHKLFAFLRVVQREPVQLD